MSKQPNYFVPILMHSNIATGKIINRSLKQRDIEIVEFEFCNFIH